MDPLLFLTEQFDEHITLVPRTRDVVAKAFVQLARVGADVLAKGGKILWFGNGGSAADAQHLAAELVVRYRVNRKALASIALTTDTSILTACGNDYSYDDIFARQVEALARPGDLLIGISTSGRSANVVAALRMAKTMGVATAGFAGHEGGHMVEVCDTLLVVPSKTTARIQEMHILLGHSLCDLWEQAAPKQ